MKKTSQNAVLLVDVGNTHTHFAISRNGRMGKQFEVSTRELRSENLVKMVLREQKKSALSGAIIASVVPSAVGILKRQFRQKLKTDPILFSAGCQLNVKIDYPNPSQIGADRLANAVGVVKNYQLPAIVVDFGTAVTFDIVSSDRKYIGGVIAPGLAAMTDYLYQRTALLPKISLARTPSVIGKSTVQAMQIGAVVGYQGLINAIVREIRAELNWRNCTVIATGGYSHLIVKNNRDFTFCDPVLTLKGLQTVYELNQTHDDESH